MHTHNNGAEKMLWFSIKGDGEHWWHETSEKKFSIDFNVKEILVCDYENNTKQMFVEVVRCKDCRFLTGDEVNQWCSWHEDLYPEPNDYCSWGVGVNE